LETALRIKAADLNVGAPYFIRHATPSIRSAIVIAIEASPAPPRAAASRSRAREKLKYPKVPL
jgi:hypothetical protein